MSVSIGGLSKTYVPRKRDDAAVPALAGIDLTVGEEELLVVVGPSGSGKSTLLRCIAGLETADTAESRWGAAT